MTDRRLDRMEERLTPHDAVVLMLREVRKSGDARAIYGRVTKHMGRDDILELDSLIDVARHGRHVSDLQQVTAFHVNQASSCALILRLLTQIADVAACALDVGRGSEWKESESRRLERLMWLARAYTASAARDALQEVHALRITRGILCAHEEELDENPASDEERADASDALASLMEALESLAGTEEMLSLMLDDEAGLADALETDCCTEKQLMETPKQCPRTKAVEALIDRICAGSKVRQSPTRA